MPKFIVSKYYFQASSPFYKTYQIDSGEWRLKRMRKISILVIVLAVLLILAVPAMARLIVLF